MHHLPQPATREAAEAAAPRSSVPCSTQAARPTRASGVRRGRARLTGAALLLMPVFAGAHVGTDAGAHHGFAQGLLHPFTGADHLAALLAVGLWSALTVGTVRHAWRAPAAFAALLLAGALLAAHGLAMPGIEPMVAASLLVLGLLLAARRALPGIAAPALVGGFALFHGAAHGVELAGSAALGGMLLGTLLLHAAGLALGLALRGRSAAWHRIAGFGIAGFGAVLLG